MRYYPQLDGLRGLCIILVLIGHQNEYSSAPIAHLSPLGGLGVLLFFSLSGFLITDILCQEDLIKGKVNLLSFYIRRARRLVPAMAAFLLVVAALRIAGKMPEVSAQEIAECALYLRNIFGRSQALGHLWSLSLEEQFYIIWPVAFYLFPGRRGTVAITTAISSLTLRTIAISASWQPYASGVYYMRPWFRFDSLLVGCLLALWFNRQTDREWNRRPGLAWWPTLVIPALFAWTMFAEVTPLLPIYLTVQTLLGTMLLTGIVAAGGASAAVLQWFPLRAIGRLSYSIYLWQQLFLVITIPGWEFARVFPLNIGIVILLAALSRYAVELPFMRTKHSEPKPG